MDNNDRENDLQNNVPEENTGKEQTETPQETPAENNDSAKAFWKETPYDEIQLRRSAVGFSEFRKR